MSRVLLSLTLLLLLSYPILAYAKSQAGQLRAQPEAVEVKNSQNISLLEGHLNINPAGAGSQQLAIVDKMALMALPDDGSAFVDLGKSGAGEIVVYTVRKGDTLSEIAEMHGVSTNTIIWANNLRNSTIREGQELVILPISGVRHTVKKGDTLKSIASRYKAELDDILYYNDLEASSKLALGDVIIIPNGVITSAPASTVRPAQSTGVSVSTGYFLRPLSSGRKSQGIHGYNAVDLAAPVGTPVMASASGRVIISRSGGYNGGYGTYVVISHPNGTQTLYAHMSANYVSVGQSVSQGQSIGAVGNTGRSTGPHLHFEVRGARNPF